MSEQSDTRATGPLTWEDSEAHKYPTFRIICTTPSKSPKDLGAPTHGHRLILQMPVRRGEGIRDVSQMPLSNGRLVLDGKRLDGDTDRNKRQSRMMVLAKTDKLATVTYRLECKGCDRSVSIRAEDLKTIVNRLVEHDVYSVELSHIPDIVASIRS